MLRSNPTPPSLTVGMIFRNSLTGGSVLAYSTSMATAGGPAGRQVRANTRTNSMTIRPSSASRNSQSSR